MCNIHHEALDINKLILIKFILSPPTRVKQLNTFTIKTVIKIEV